MFVQGGGPAEVEALSVVDAEAGEQAGGLFAADVLGDCLLAHAGGDVDRCFGQEPGGFVASASFDDLAVDLEVVEREVLEVVEGAIAGAEVVERESATDAREV